MQAPVTKQHATPESASCHQRLYRVSLIDHASIVERGEQLQVWWVRVNDAWVRAPEHPNANIELESSSDEEVVLTGFRRTCAPGVIWRRCTELLLEPGTRLLRRQTRPRTRNLSVMGYLTLGVPRAQRVMQEREFQLVGNYRLVPVGRMQLSTDVERHCSKQELPVPN